MHSHLTLKLGTASHARPSVLKHIVVQEFLQTVTRDVQPLVQASGIHSPFVALLCTSKKLSEGSQSQHSQQAMVQQAQFENVKSGENGVTEQEQVPELQVPQPAKAAAKSTARKGRTAKQTAAKA